MKQNFLNDLGDLILYKGASIDYNIIALTMINQVIYDNPPEYFLYYLSNGAIKRRFLNTKVDDINFIFEKYKYNKVQLCITDSIIPVKHTLVNKTEDYEFQALIYANYDGKFLFKKINDNGITGSLYFSNNLKIDNTNENLTLIDNL